MSRCDIVARPAACFSVGRYIVNISDLLVFAYTVHQLWLHSNDILKHFYTAVHSTDH